MQKEIPLVPFNSCYSFPYMALSSWLLQLFERTFSAILILLHPSFAEAFLASSQIIVCLCRESEAERIGLRYIMVSVQADENMTEDASVCNWNGQERRRSNTFN